MLTLPGERQNVNWRSRRERRSCLRRQEDEFDTRFRPDNDTFRQDLADAARRAAERRFEEECEIQVESLLGRKNGEWRKRRDTSEASECCCKCGSHRRVDFYRKGHRVRHLQTTLGLLTLRVPRVKCLCGGEVGITFRHFDRYARRYVDVKEEIYLLSGMCLSLRQVQAVYEVRGQRLGIATICGEVAAVADLSAEVFAVRVKEAPPVVMLDGIFAHAAEETGEEFRNKVGRRRKRKKVRKKPLLVAWGVWPETGEKVLLGWVSGDAEDQESWLKLLKDLDKRGICYRNGLRLFIHDGSTGLAAAFEEITFGPVEYQRCIFHKMRNVLDAVRGEPKMSREQKRERRREVLADLIRVWEGCTEEEARARLEAFAAAWQEKEPLAVERLRKGFDATLVYYQVQRQAWAEGHEWTANYLRTTSLHERWNRTIRTKLRAAVIFQTERGMRGNVYLTLTCREKTKPGQLGRLMQELAASAGTASVGVRK